MFEKRTIPFTLLLAAAVRYWLMNSDLQKIIASRVELSTPLNAYKRTLEARHKNSLGLDPYAEDLYHASPLHLQMFACPEWFIALDLATSIAVYAFCRRRAEATLVVYLFNPYTLLNCVAMTGTCFANFTVALLLCGIAHRNFVLCSVGLALSAFNSCYALAFAMPVYLCLGYNRRRCAVLTGALLLGLLGASRLAHGSWSFLRHTYGTELGVTEHQPNVGVFWYFVVEIFTHFESFFLVCLQLNALVLHLLPLSLTLRKDPPMLAMCLLYWSALFKSYPSFGDYGLIVGLLPCWSHLYGEMPQLYLGVCNAIATSALIPTFWNLWIGAGAGNANFYFGGVLAFVTGHIFLLVDLIVAHAKYEWKVRNEKCGKVDLQWR